MCAKWANAHLFKVYALQEKERIHACMLLGGFDDQDPNDWDDEECKTAGDVTILVTNLFSSDSDVSHDDGDDLPATCYRNTRLVCYTGG